MAPGTEFARVFCAGIGPLQLGVVLVSPIFKKGDKHAKANYRPVSLTSVCCQLLEHIVCKHVLSHLEAHSILSDLHHGFRSGHLCESQLLITIDDLLEITKCQSTNRPHNPWFFEGIRYGTTPKIATQATKIRDIWHYQHVDRGICYKEKSAKSLWME